MASKRLKKAMKEFTAAFEEWIDEFEEEPRGKAGKEDPEEEEDPDAEEEEDPDAEEEEDPDAEEEEDPDAEEEEDEDEKLLEGIPYSPVKLKKMERKQLLKLAESLGVKKLPKPTSEAVAAIVKAQKKASK